MLDEAISARVSQNIPFMKTGVGLFNSSLFPMKPNKLTKLWLESAFIGF